VCEQFFVLIGFLLETYCAEVAALEPPLFASLMQVGV
jgi:hypothetical protein